EHRELTGTLAQPQCALCDRADHRELRGAVIEVAAEQHAVRPLVLRGAGKLERNLESPRIVGGTREGDGRGRRIHGRPTRDAVRVDQPDDVAPFTNGVERW